MQEIIKEAALGYLELGYSVIPVGKDKKPPIEWKMYQTERATAADIESWLTKYPDMCLGIVTGAISGLVAVDVENGGDDKKFPPTVKSKTGGGGWHLLYRHPGTPVANKTKFGHLTDLRGDGGYIIAPPSVSEKGSYEWMISPWDLELAEYPAELIAKIEASNSKKSWRELIEEDAFEGVRNSRAAVISGGLLGSIPRDEWEQSAWPRLSEWNESHCKPSLSAEELRKTFDSIKSLEEAKPEPSSKEGNQTQSLMDLVLKDASVELFRDQYDTPCARIPVSGHLETMECGSRKFSFWLVRSYMEKHSAVPQQSTVSAAVQALSAYARFSDVQRTLHNRVAQTDDAVWYDLANDAGQAVRITPEGWQVVNNPPNLFRKELHMTEQVSPQPNGDVRKLLSFLNISEPSQQLLMLVYIVSCFIPGFPHPILYLHGQRGAAKSTASRYIRKLVDPSRIPVVSMAKKVGQASQQLLHHHFIVYENVTKIPDEISDLLCIAVTGGGIEDREYYTNADAFIYSIRTNIGINGINVAATKPDLLERCILMELERVNTRTRRSESKLDAAFEEARASVLGGILDTVAKAMKIRPQLEIDELPRMADFALWGCAIAEALGYTSSDFLSAYESKLEQQEKQAILSSPEAKMVLKLMNNVSVWEGTPDQLYKALTGIMNEEGSTPDHEFAKGTNVMSARLNDLKSNFPTVGLEYATSKSGKRHVVIRRIEAAEAASEPSKGDDVSTSGFVNADQPLSMGDADGSDDET